MNVRNSNTKEMKRFSKLKNKGKNTGKTNSQNHRVNGKPIVVLAEGLALVSTATAPFEWRITAS